MIFRYVRHHLVNDYACLGWCIAHDLQDCCHGRYSVLMQWCCTCKCIEPKEGG